MTINDVFTKAYEYLVQALSEVVKAVKKDSQAIKGSVDKVAPVIKSSIDSQTISLSKALNQVTEAVNNKEVAKEVRVANPEAISGEIVTGLTDVVKTLKDEIKKFDREIVVKNDLSALASAFKSNQEKKDFIAALKQIENKIKQPELTDYTVLLGDIADAVEKVTSSLPKVKLTAIEETLNDIRALLNQPQEFIPADLIHYDRLKVELPDEQVKSMSKSAQVISQSGGIQGDLVNTNSVGSKQVKVLLDDLSASVKGIEPQEDSLAVTLATDHYDETTRSVNTIGYEHHEIHSGSHYFICDYDSSIAINETIQFVVTTPNTTKWTHLILDFSSTLGCSLDIYEGSSSVVGGSPATPINNNRNSLNTSSLTIIKDPTSLTDGTKIAGYLAGANKTGGASEREREIILKQNTTYLFRFTSLSNGNAISFCGEWYEHTNKSNA